MAAKADGIVLPETATQKFTLTAPVGSEVSVTLGVYANEDVYAVDFGDGVQVVDSVGNENGGIKGADGLTKEGTAYAAATKFSGKVAGDGTIKVYGTSDLWYLVLAGGAYPTSFDQAGLAKVVQMNISGADVESVVLPASDVLKQFSFNNSSLTTLNVTKATALTSLTVNTTSASAFDPQLTSIDLSQNTELTYLSLQGDATKPGKLTAIDLTANTKLENIMLQNNQLANVKLGDYSPTGTINFSNNKLTAFDGAFVKKSSYVDLSVNLLTTLDLSGQEKKGNIKIQDNLFTLATLPAKPSVTTASKYVYYPQSAYKVAETLMTLDLTSQLTATGVLTEPATTTFSFVTASGTDLVEGTDYEVTEAGKFKFLTTPKEKVHGVMTTTAFPKFTGKNAYVTTDFTIGKTPTFDFENNNGGWPIGEGSEWAKGVLNEANPITMDEVTLTGLMGTSKNDVRYMKNASKGQFLQVFKGNQIKLTAPKGKNIVKAEVTMQTGSFDLTPSVGSVTDNVWTGAATEVTFTATATRYIYAIDVTVEDISAVNVAVDDDYTSFAAAINLDFSATGIKVYTAKRTDNYVVLTEVESGLVPAGAGVILAGDAKTYTVPMAAEAAALANNELVGVTEQTTVNYAESGNFNYILQGGVFKKATGAKLNAGKAYLSTAFDVAATSDSRLIIVIGNETTGITTVGAQQSADNLYDLQGRQVQKPAKGVYIVNGKKVIVK